MASYLRVTLARLLVVGVCALLTACGGPAAVAVQATTAGAAAPAALTTSSGAQTSLSVASASSTSQAEATSASSASAVIAATTTATAIAPSAITATASSATATAATAPAAASSAVTAYPLTVKDDQGTTLTFQAKPQHVVSLVPSSTEIVYAVDGGGELAAGTQYDNYPPEAKSKALIKGLKPSLETVMAYQPDLVLAGTSNASDLVQQLRTLRVPVFYLDAHDFAGVYHDIALVGEILDGEPAAEQVVAHMQQEVDQVTSAVARATTRPRVFIEVSADPSGQIFTVGPGSFVDNLVTLAGGANVFHDAKSEYPQIGLEALVSADPQTIILDDAAYGATPAVVAQRAGWSAISAVKAQHIFPINDDLVSRPGPRLADGLLAMAKLIHPELFQ